MHKKTSQLQNSGWISSNPTLSLFSGWNKLHGGSMERNSSSEIDQRGEADRRSRVLQLAQTISGIIFACVALIGCNADTANNSQAKTDTAFMTHINAPDPVRGASLFADNCAACHGQGGTGSDQGPPLIHRIYEPSHHDDASFYRAIGGGSPQHHWQFGDMPSIPGVRVEDIRHIIAYVRQQQRQAGIE